MEPARGFIALISAVIISAILMGMAATLDQGAFFARFDALYGEYQHIALSLADSCIEVGLGKLADDYDYLVSSDPGYDPVRKGVPVPLGSIYGTPVACVLTAPTTTPAEAGHARAFTVIGKSSFNGSYATKRATVLVTNPAYGTGRADPYVVVSDWREIP